MYWHRACKQSIESTLFDRIAQQIQTIQVLSDPSKRQVYDIYGKEGLTSGLEVSSAVNSAEELRKKWEKFKAQEVRLSV